jgi:hypothetical protein
MDVDEEGWFCLCQTYFVLCICATFELYKIRIANRHNGGQDAEKDTTYGVCTVLYGILEMPLSSHQSKSARLEYGVGILCCGRSCACTTGQ